jgi:hypothetical protein
MDTPPTAGGSSLPAPQHRERGGKIRWAIGDTNGRRSQTWSVVGFKNDDDVYIGPRMRMGVIKLSLHRSGEWRMAWTEEYAELAGLPKEQDRVLERWNPPAEATPGWRHAVTIAMMTDSLAAFPPEKGENKVARYPVPEPPGPLFFEVFIGAPAKTIAMQAIEVGTLKLPSGGMIGVCVRRPDLSQDGLSALYHAREEMVRSVTQSAAPNSQGFAWGRLPNGRVYLLDPGIIQPAGVPPSGITNSPLPGGYVYRRIRAD